MLTRHFGDRMRQLLSQQEELILFRQRIEAGRKLNNALMDIVSNDIFSRFYHWSCKILIQHSQYHDMHGFDYFNTLSIAEKQKFLKAIESYLKLEAFS